MVGAVPSTIINSYKNIILPCYQLFVHLRVYKGYKAGNFIFSNLPDVTMLPDISPLRSPLGTPSMPFRMGTP